MGHHNNPLNYEVFTSFSVAESRFYFEAHIKGRTHTSDQFSREAFNNWNLWDFDVFELFLSRLHPEQHYLELQISPLGQKFALLIKKPRKEYEEIAPKDLRYSAELHDNGFTVKGSLALDDIPGKEKTIKGNLHACLGPREQRCFFGLKINPEDKADFHRPDNFIQLGEWK